MNEREVEALRRVEAIQRLHARWPRRKLPIFEPRPGCVAMYPASSPESDGERVVVPLAGTRFSITSGEGRAERTALTLEIVGFVSNRGYLKCARCYQHRDCDQSLHRPLLLRDADPDDDRRCDVCGVDLMRPLSEKTS